MTKIIVKINEDREEEVMPKEADEEVDEEVFEAEAVLPEEEEVVDHVEDKENRSKMLMVLRSG
jgi:hypothetical protein